jgi:hypothetical protein
MKLHFGFNNQQNNYIWISKTKYDWSGYYIIKRESNNHGARLKNFSEYDLNHLLDEL